MGDSNYDKTSGPNFITARFIADELSSLASSQVSLTASQTSGSLAATAAHSGKVVLVSVAADAGFSSLTGSVTASVTSTISGVLAGY